MRRFFANPFFAGLLAVLLFTSPLLHIITSWPLLLTTGIGGLINGFIALGLLLGSAALFGQGEGRVIALFLFELIPLTAAWLLRGGWSLRQSIAVVYSLGFLFLLLGYPLSLLLGVDVDGLIHQEVNDLLTVLQTYVQHKMDPVSESHYRLALEQARPGLIDLFPILTVGGWFLLQTLNLWLAGLSFSQWQEPFWVEEPFRDFRLPFFWVWPLIGVGLVVLAADGRLSQLGSNLLIYLAIPYFFQGLAVLKAGFYYLRLWPLLQGIGVGLVFMFMTWLVPLITVLGLLDTWSDFRARLLRILQRPDLSA